jgi:hypothetical protein
VALSAFSLDVPPWATDEAILDEIDADFWAVAGANSLEAAGKDGVITQADPWTLTSPTVDFAGLGVMPGRVIKLNAPIGTPAAKSFGTANVLGVVDSASGRDLTLRRSHATASGLGMPFVPPGAGDVTGLTFEIRTFDDHLLHGARQFRQDLKSIAPDSVLTAVLDDQDLTDGNLYYTLSDVYYNRSQSLAATGTGADIYGEKARLYRGYRDDQLARIEKRATMPITPATIARGGLTGGVLRVRDATAGPEWG